MFPTRKKKTVSEKFWEDSNSEAHGLARKEEFASQGPGLRYFLH